MATVKEIIELAESKMHKTTDVLRVDLASVRAGRATPALLEKVMVDYYGTPTPVNQVASVTVPEPRMIIIQPWEKSMIQKIEKSIMDANIGLTPQNNGEQIRCNIPPLTEERRKELIKKARTAGENSKVVVRNARRDAVDLLKKAQKNDGLPEDAQKEGEDEVQKVTDKNVKEIDALIAAKEKDIMTV